MNDEIEQALMPIIDYLKSEYGQHAMIQSGIFMLEAKARISRLLADARIDENEKVKALGVTFNSDFAENVLRNAVFDRIAELKRMKGDADERN